MKIVKKKVTHSDIKSKSESLLFLKSSDRNPVLLQALLALSNFELLESEKGFSKKVESVCVAYESVIHSRNLNVVTIPTMAKNLRLLKETHNRGLLELVGYPSGGNYHTIQSLLNIVLPELKPPQNDFVSVDDNIQVKRVVASRNLQEDFKHVVKVYFL